MRISEWRAAAQIAIKRAIDVAYPFGERAYHPYKVWLSVRKDYLCYLGIESKGKAVKEYQRCIYCKDSKEGCLFCFRRM